MSIRARQRGVTLIELVMFILIIGIALAGLLRVLSLNSSASADPIVRKQALMIAESLMEEVQQAGFTYCDPTDANARSAVNTAGCASLPEVFGQEVAGNRPYDNVNDYVSAANTATAAFTVGGKVADANGEALALNTNYTATVLITPETLGSIAANPSGSNQADAEVLRITIKVSFGSENITLDGYRTRYAPVPQ